MKCWIARGLKHLHIYIELKVSKKIFQIRKSLQMTKVDYWGVLCKNQSFTTYDGSEKFSIFFFFLLKVPFVFWLINVSCFVR